MALVRGEPLRSVTRGWSRAAGVRVSAAAVLAAGALVSLAGTGMAQSVSTLPASGVAIRNETSTPLAYWGTVFITGDKSEATSPTVIDVPGSVVQVASSNSTEYALLSNGEVYAWGFGTNGELGDGGTASSFTTAVQVHFPPGVTIAALPTDVMPYDVGLAIDTTGHVWGWGRATYGVLCLGTTAQYTTPVELPFTDVTAVAGAGDHALYDSNGIVYACGWNTDGELGDGNTRSSSKPVEVTGLAGQNVQALVASFADSGALLASGTYFDWGYDGQGQLGDGKTGVNADTPVEVNLPLPVTRVAQGGSYFGNGQTMVQLSDGSLRSWGSDQSGQLGNDKRVNQPSPIEFSPPPGVSYMLLASGGSTSYAVSTTGDVYAWGFGGAGQIGNGSTATELNPVLVESGVSLISSTAEDVVTQ
jgi:alpha-tubulin suppressor-like RCC1 family protein